jgi:hypothetical protein
LLPLRHWTRRHARAGSGDTDFSQTQHLDRWDGEGVRFIFGYDASVGLIRRAEALPESGACASAEDSHSVVA